MYYIREGWKGMRRRDYKRRGQQGVQEEKATKPVLQDGVQGELLVRVVPEQGHQQNAQQAFEDDVQDELIEEPS
jgi:hypothetical protein